MRICYFNKLAAVPPILEIGMIFELLVQNIMNKPDNSQIGNRNGFNNFVNHSE